MKTFMATQSIFASISPNPLSNHNPKPPQLLSHSLQPIPAVKTHQQQQCECFNLHKELVPYRQAWSWQKSLVKQKKTPIENNENCPDSLIVLQHPPVYTMGTCSSVKYLNFDIDNALFDVHRTERGGDVTYHGPGQIVMYPIMNLRNHKMDLHWYLRSLEEVIICALWNTFSIKASRLEGLTGIWHGKQKLAAIGIRVSQWIAYHGLVVNVSTDLSPFRWIVPCGLQDYQVGSVRGLLGKLDSCNDGRRKLLPDLDDGLLLDTVCKSLINEFSEVFQVGISYEAISRLEGIESESVNSLEEDVVVNNRRCEPADIVSICFIEELVMSYNRITQ